MYKAWVAYPHSHLWRILVKFVIPSYDKGILEPFLGFYSLLNWIDGFLVVLLDHTSVQGSLEYPPDQTLAVPFPNTYSTLYNTYFAMWDFLSI